MVAANRGNDQVFSAVTRKLSTYSAHSALAGSRCAFSVRVFSIWQPRHNASGNRPRHRRSGPGPGPAGPRGRTRGGRACRRTYTASRRGRIRHRRTRFHRRGSSFAWCRLNHLVLLRSRNSRHHPPPRPFLLRVHGCGQPGGDHRRGQGINPAPLPVLVQRRITGTVPADSALAHRAGQQ